MPILIKGGGGSVPSGTKNITSNGTYDVADYASAKVAVPQPSGTKSITANGTHDVASYAYVNVAVPAPEGSSNGVALMSDAFTVPNGALIRISFADALSELGLSADSIKSVKHISMWCELYAAKESGMSPIYYFGDSDGTPGTYEEYILCSCDPDDNDGDWKDAAAVSSVSIDGPVISLYLDYALPHPSSYLSSVSGHCTAVVELN